MITLRDVSIFLGILPFFPLWYEMIWKNKRQSVLTIIFWASLDLLFGLSALIASPRGSYELPLWYSFFGFLTALIAWLKNKKIEFGKDEKRVFFLSIISTVIFGLSLFKLLGENSATISGYSSIFCLTIVSYFMLKDAWNFPKEFPTPYIYIIFTIANFLNALSGKDMSLLEIGFGITYTIICGLVVLFSLNLLQKK